MMLKWSKLVNIDLKFYSLYLMDFEILLSVVVLP